LDRINRIVGIKRPPAEGPLAAGDRKFPKSCKSCLSKKHKIESIPMFHISRGRWRKDNQIDQKRNFLAWFGNRPLLGFAFGNNTAKM
jgi:hypothetical protein